MYLSLRAVWLIIYFFSWITCERQKIQWPSLPKVLVETDITKVRQLFLG